MVLDAKRGMKGKPVADADAVDPDPGAGPLPFFKQHPKGVANRHGYVKGSELDIAVEPVLQVIDGLVTQKRLEPACQVTSRAGQESEDRRHGDSRPQQFAAQHAPGFSRTSHEPGLRCVSAHRSGGSQQRPDLVSGAVFLYVIKAFE
jgi:hypothetical protein